VSAELATLLGVKGPEIGPIQIDAAITETHSLSAQVVQHPIEDGAEIADHISLNSRTYQLEGVVARAPNSVAGALTQGLFSRKDQEAYLDLETLFENREPFVVVTGLRVYPSMVFSRFTVRRNKDTGQVLSFSAEMVEIRVVKSETVAAAPIPSANAKGAPKTDQGPKPVTPAPEAAAASSGSTLSKIGTVDGLEAFKAWVGGLAG